MVGEQTSNTNPNDMKQTIENTWEVNLVTGAVNLAKFKPGSFFASSNSEGLQTTETFILVEKQDCKYFMALNKKNAERKGVSLFYQEAKKKTSNVSVSLGVNDIYDRH